MPDNPRLLIHPDRVFYDGLLGRPGVRVLGSYTVYAATEGEVRLVPGTAGGKAEDDAVWFAPAVAVAPFVPHTVSTANRQVRCLMIEPEFVDLGAMPEGLPGGLRIGGEAFERFGWPQRLARLSADLRRDDAQALLPAGSAADFDRQVFGEVLPSRTLDPRIADVVRLIRTDPATEHSAADCAARCHLSPSRFLHLFKSECGVPFRAFKSWKRARSLLQAVASPQSLTAVAHELGYSDSAYFSHAIRHYTGLRPKDIMAGARRIRVIAGR